MPTFILTNDVLALHEEEEKCIKLKGKKRCLVANDSRKAGILQHGGKFKTGWGGGGGGCIKRTLLRVRREVDFLVSHRHGETWQGLALARRSSSRATLLLRATSYGVLRAYRHHRTRTEDVH